MFFFLFPRLEHPAEWICARYKSLLLLLLLIVDSSLTPVTNFCDSWLDLTWLGQEWLLTWLESLLAPGTCSQQARIVFYNHFNSLWSLLAPGSQQARIVFYNHFNPLESLLAPGSQQARIVFYNHFNPLESLLTPGSQQARFVFYNHLNRNSIFCFNPFFPGRPFIKRPEEKKGNGNVKKKFFFSLESATYDRQHAARAAVISVALISRLIPRTPADYVYVCNERTMNLVRLRTYVCCSGKRSYHTQPWNQVYDFMRRWFPIAVFI